MSKYKKTCIVLTVILAIGMFLFCSHCIVRVPTNENYNIMKEYCNQVADTFDTNIEDSNYTANIERKQNKVIVKVSEDTAYIVKAEYDIISQDLTGNTKTMTIDIENAEYFEMIGDKNYSAWTKTLHTIMNIMLSICFSGFMSFAVWSIIYYPARDRKNKIK